jgi:hypothetical protein
VKSLVKLGWHTENCLKITTLSEDRSKVIQMLSKEIKHNRMHQEVHQQDQLDQVKLKKGSQQLKILKMSSQRNVQQSINKKLLLSLKLPKMAH